MTLNLWHFASGDDNHDAPLRPPLPAADGFAGLRPADLVCHLIKWKSPLQEFVPFAILGIVLLLGMVFGRSVGMLGSVIAALIFAYSMYEPLGSLRIADQGARSGVAWMLLAGITLSYLLLPARRERSKRGH